MQVLTRCQDLCLRDRTAANNLVRTCSSFDFQPGKRLTLPTALTVSFNAGSTPSAAGAIEYEESVCFLSRELPRPEGLGTLVNLPGQYLYSEVCLSCKFPNLFHDLLSFEKSFLIGSSTFLMLFWNHLHLLTRKLITGWWNDSGQDRTWMSQPEIRFRANHSQAISSCWFERILCQQPYRMRG